MIRWGLRLLALLYIALPLLALFVGFNTWREMNDRLVPLYETAASRIGDAREGLEDTLDDLRDDFQPVVNTVNSLRSGLSSIASFINNSVNDVIDFVNGFPLMNIPRFNVITIPSIISVGFLDDIAEDVSDITGEFDSVLSQTATFAQDQAQAMGLILLLVVAWLALTQLLLVIVVFKTLWI
jgi:hypothetical protein